MAEKEDSASSSPTSTGHPAEACSGYCLCRPEPKIPRPRNAFILYRQHQQASVVRKYPGLPNPDISKIIGEQWSKLPETQKNEWKAHAEEEKARHAQQYPDYRYQPRRNGRYSAGSSGQSTGHSTTGSKVDSQGNCIKCGGKTMNPPTTPHHPVRAQRSQDRDRLASPLQGSSPYDPRDPRNMIHPSYHSRDPRHDPRYHPGYRPSISGPPPPASAIEPHGHDLKRRRFDGGGLYIPTREYREDPGYAYSPRGPPPYHRAEMGPPDMHAPRSAIMSPPRALYPPPPMAGRPPPKLQPIRPPSHHGHDPSLKLPPLNTPTLPPPNPSSTSQPADKQIQTQTSGLEAMIMSIPVLNKVKILSTVSPSLANPHPTSPPLDTRGAIVAIEGSDLTSVWSMTQSLTSQLEKDGKFVVKIFMGLDPAEIFVGPVDPFTSKRKGVKGPLSTADVLRLVEKWHKISDEMRRFVTTRPGAAIEATGPAAEKRVSDVEMSEDSADVPLSTPIKAGSFAERKPSTDVPMSDGSILKPTETLERVTFDLPPENEGSPRQQDCDKDRAISPKSVVSPQTLTKTSDLSITTPPVTRSTSRSEVSPSSAMPYQPPASKFDTMPPPSPAKPSTPTSATAPTSAPTQPTTPLASSTILPLPTTSRPSLVSAGPIPIALIPQYQLSTTNYASINTQISDSYSPGSHWQWVAALWRGAIGPDVTIAIHSVPASGYAGDDAPSEPPLSDERMPGHANAPPRDRTGSVVMAAATGRGIQTMPGQAPKPAAAGPGVEVRLLDYRAVVVRTMATMETTVGEVQFEEEKKKAEEFWEKAKRRVGFEVAEFLRR